MARRITVKKVLSGIPSISDLKNLRDVNDSGLGATNAYLKYDSDSQKFVFTSLSAITSGVSSLNSLTGDITIAGAGTVSVGTAGSTITITGTGGTGGLDSAAVNTLIAAADTHDSAAVQGQISNSSIGTLSDVDISGISTNQILKWDGSKFAVAADAGGGLDSSAVIGIVDSAYVRPLARAAIVAGTNITYDSATGLISSTASGTVDSGAVNTLIAAADTHDSAAVLGQINSTVNFTFVNALSGTFDSSHIPKIVLGTDTTGNYVSDISGTANQIAVSNSTGSVTISQPSNVTIDSNLTVGGYIAGPSVFTIDPAAIGDSTGKVVILGDLQVDGVQTTINSTTVSISDKNIVLADSATNSSQADGAGITVNGANATLQYASTGDKWVFNKAPFYNTNRILTTADDLHDSDAVLGQINATVDATFVRPLARAALVAGNNITYDSSTGVIASTASGGTDSSAVVSIADSRISVASIGDLSDVDLTGIATNRILKWNGNKFVTAADATGSGGAGIALTDISATNTAGKFGSLSYNNVSGVFTYTGPDSDDTKTVTGIPYGNLTGTPNILDSTNVNSLIDSGITSNILGTANQVTVTTGSKTATIGLPTNVTVDSNLTVGGYIAGPAVFTIDPAAVGDSTGKVVILGDLQVDGTTTTINSTTVSISDKNIVLADSAADSSQANGAGITVNGANATITYTSLNDRWTFNKAPYYNAHRLLTDSDDLHDSAAVQGQIDASLTAATQFLRSDQSDSMAGSLTIDSNLTVLGNATVNGTLTVSNNSEVRFTDNIITFNYGFAGAPSDNVGFEVIRGSQPTVNFVWNEDDGYWDFNTQDVNTTGKMLFSNEYGDLAALHAVNAQTYRGMVAHVASTGKEYIANGDSAADWHALLDEVSSTTDDLSEGATNKYYTFNKVDSDVGTIVNTAYVNALNVNADTVDNLQASQFLRSDSDDTMAANLTVTGTVTAGTGSNTTVVNAADVDQYSIKHNLTGVTVTTGNATQISTFAHNSSATSVEYVMHLQQATTNKTQVTKVLATFDGTNVEFTEYGQIYTGDSDLGAFTVSNDGSNIDLNFTRRGSNNITVKIAKTVIA